MGWKRLILGLFLLLLYLATSGLLVYLSYSLFPPTNADQYKEFGVRAGIALSAVGAFFGFAVSFFTLSTQIKAAQSLAGYQAKLQKGLEEVKGDITKRVNFLSQALSTQSAAYDKLFVASEHSYRELQHLNAGTFDKQRVETREEALNEAIGLAANLPPEVQEIAQRFHQTAMNLSDEAKKVTAVGAERSAALVDLWRKYTTELGRSMDELRERSLFRSQNFRQESQ